MDNAQSGTLAGRRVLIVEDEFYLADDLRRELAASGADVAGPANTLERARALMAGRIDFAVLDVNLRGEMIFPLADELRERGVPFIFTTGYDPEVIPATYQDVERWQKPVASRQLLQALAKL